MTRATGISSALLDYFYAFPGKVITIDELVKKYDQWDRNKIMSAISNLQKTTIGTNIERLQTGVWRLVEEKESKVNTGTNTLMLSIIKQNDEGHIIAVDEEFNIYKMTLVG